MSRLSMNLKVMPKSQKGHHYILCVIDEVTNYLVTAPIYQATSEEIGDTLIEKCHQQVWNTRVYHYGSRQCMFKRLGIKIKTVGLYNHQSLQTEHGIKSFSGILTEHLMGQGQNSNKLLCLATFVYNTFNTTNLCNHSPSELIFGGQPKILLDLETDPNIKVSGTYQDYYNMLNKRLHYLQSILQNFRSKQVALINKDREYFQYNGRDLVYLISPITIQLRTASRKVAIRYVGPLVIYKIVDPHNYLLMTMDGKLLRGVFEHKRLKPAVLKTDQGYVSTLPTLKKVMNLEIA